MSKTKSNKKNNQSKKSQRISRVFVLFTMVFMVIIFVLFVQFSVAVNRSLRQINYSQFEEDELLREIDYSKDLSVAILGIDNKRSSEGLFFVDSIQIFQIDFSQSQTFSLTVDPELTVDFLDNLGDFQTIRNSYQLKQLYNYWRTEGFSESDSLDLFTKQLEKTLGLRIDRYIWLELSDLEEIFNLFLIKGSAEQQISELTGSDGDLDKKLIEMNNKYISYWKSIYNPVTWAGLSYYVNAENKNVGQGIKTNFSNRELSNFLWRGRIWQDYQINTAITGNKLQYVNFDFKYLDNSEFDQEYRTYIEDTQIKLEQARIDLINGSGVNRLATNTRRLLVNEGFNIVRTDNSEINYDQAKLYLADPLLIDEFPLTIERLKLIYPGLEVTTEEFPGRPTGDLILVVVE